MNQDSSAEKFQNISFFNDSLIFDEFSEKRAIGLTGLHNILQPFPPPLFMNNIYITFPTQEYRSKGLMTGHVFLIPKQNKQTFRERLDWKEINVCSGLVVI